MLVWIFDSETFSESGLIQDSIGGDEDWGRLPLGEQIALEGESGS